MTSTEVLRAEDLRAILGNGRAIVDNVSLSVQRGEVVAVVGESGSGKSTTALALLGFAKPGVTLAEGSLTVAGERVPLDNERAARTFRGQRISYVPQDPSSALNPVHRVERLITDMRAVHGLRADDAFVQKELERVGLPGTADFRSRFPHQLSGGQRQRLAIAVALACNPSVLILDEPTTALDVLAQAQFQAEIDRLRRDEGVGVVYITHDVASIATLADTIVVMYDGRIVERGPARQVLHRPRHPYTAALLACAPDVETRRKLLPIAGTSSDGYETVGCAYVPRCELAVARCSEAMPPEEAVGTAHLVRCYESSRVRLAEVQHHIRQEPQESAPVLEARGLGVEYRRRGKVVASVEDVSFAVGRGECLAVVGASGSGKTTVARAVMGLVPTREGEVRLLGQVLPSRIARRSADQLRAIQMVFQNPFESLNPRRTVLDQVARPALTLRGHSRRDAEAAAQRLLDLVRLPNSKSTLLPRELSGGERQRVALARALVSEPDVLVCDEITSALDVSVQAAVLETLGDLSQQLGLAVLFITHDLGVVASVADRVLVLEAGQIRETGPTERVLREPRQDYTRRLIAAAPRIPAETAAS